MIVRRAPHVPPDRRPRGPHGGFQLHLLHISAYQDKRFVRRKCLGRLGALEIVIRGGGRAGTSRKRGSCLDLDGDLVDGGARFAACRGGARRGSSTAARTGGRCFRVVAHVCAFSFRATTCSSQVTAFLSNRCARLGASMIRASVSVLEIQG